MKRVLVSSNARRVNRHVEINPRYFRPSEVDLLLGKRVEGRVELVWSPMTSFDQLDALMADHDLDLAERELHAAGNRQSRGQLACSV